MRPFLSHDKSPDYHGISLCWGWLEYGRGAAGWHLWVSPWCGIGTERYAPWGVRVTWGRD